MKQFCPLGSGSKGNAIYFSSGDTRLLIDAGLSGKAIIERLASLDVDINTIDAILISHEHIDHIRALRKLAIQKDIPVLANAETAKAIYAKLGDCPKFQIFTSGETFQFQDLSIHPFLIQHDAAEPVAFIIETDDTKFGFCTDLGFATTLVRSRLQGCHYLYVEANHQPSMVHACPRPMIYKQRVLGRSGHLSNEACAELIDEIYHDDLRHVHLAHLSEECNNPDVALKIMEEKLGGRPLTISIAPQHTVGEITHF
jgi:phosphoribosyl 1,2-cyclic phosphodiesterase